MNKVLHALALILLKDGGQGKVQGALDAALAGGPSESSRDSRRNTLFKEAYLAVRGRAGNPLSGRYFRPALTGTFNSRTGARTWISSLVRNPHGAIGIRREDGSI